MILPGDSGQTPHRDMDIRSGQGSVLPWTYNFAQGQSGLIGQVWVTLPSPKLGNEVSPGHPRRTRCVRKGYLYTGKVTGFSFKNRPFAVSVNGDPASAIPTTGGGAGVEKAEPRERDRRCTSWLAHQGAGSSAA